MQAVTKTILLAEDDPAHVALICRALEKVGFACQVDVVGSGPGEIVEFDGVDSPDTLAERLKRGAIPVDEAPTIPTDIAAQTDTARIEKKPRVLMISHLLLRVVTKQ